MVRHASIDKETTGGHAFFLYNSLQERIDLLAKYFQEGVTHNELCIFVTPESSDEAIESFQAAGFDAKVPFEEGSLRIFEMNPTYLPEGHFVADYMLNSVRSFIEDTEAHGYSGLRTAGEMCWLVEHPEAIKDAKSYEHDVNTLTTPDSNFVGLCLYPVHDTFNEVLAAAIHTHPSFIYDGKVRTNPYYEMA